MIIKWILRIAILLVFSLVVRIGVIQPVINYKLSKKAQHKIKEGQIFIEWFLYSRFRKYIPPLMIWWYFSNFIFCIVTAVISIVWVLIVGDNENVTLVNTIFMAVSFFPVAFVYIFVYNSGEYGIVYVVDRNKRYRKKKKKHPLQKKK